MEYICTDSRQRTLGAFKEQTTADTALSAEQKECVYKTLTIIAKKRKNI